MDSSTALVQAASRLESNMTAPMPGGIMKESLSAHISAILYYKASVISKLTTNKAFKNKFSEVIFEQIDKDFGEYIDALARSKPKSLHHVYEWKRVGQKNARLFELSKTSEQGLSFKVAVNYKLSKSVVPNKISRRRHVFINKAEVMEAGQPLIIRPRNAERLVFQGDTGIVFMGKGKSVTVKRPGGPGVKNQFGLATSRFFNGQLINASIKKSGFQKIFGSAMGKALSVPPSIKKVQYSFRPNTIRAEAEAQLTAAFGGVL